MWFGYLRFLGVRVPKSLVIWVSPLDTQNTDPASGESEVIWENFIAIYLYANSSALLMCLLLWILWRYWI